MGTPREPASAEAAAGAGVVHRLGSMRGGAPDRRHDTQLRRTQSNGPARSTVGRGPGTPSCTAPECENDTGGRFTLRRSADSQSSECATGAVATSCGQAARSSSAERAAMAVAGATPRPEGLVRHSGEFVFTIRRPPSRGRSRVKDPCRKAVQHRFEAAEQSFAAHPSVGAAGVPVATRFGERAVVVQRAWAVHSSLLTGIPTFRFRTRTTGSACSGRCTATARGWQYRDEAAVACGSGVAARAGRGAGEGGPDDARSGPRQRQRRCLAPQVIRLVLSRHDRLGNVTWPLRATNPGLRTRWPSRKGLMDRERPRAGGGMAVHIPTIAVPYEACRTGGSLPATARRTGPASANREAVV